MKSISIRIQEEQQRKTQRAQFTSAQQLEALDERLGVGLGAAKERARLAGSKK